MGSRRNLSISLALVFMDISNIFWSNSTKNTGIFQQNKLRAIHYIPLLKLHLLPMADYILQCLLQFFLLLWGKGLVQEKREQIRKSRKQPLTKSVNQEEFIRHNTFCFIFFKSPRIIFASRAQKNLEKENTESTSIFFFLGHLTWVKRTKAYESNKFL